MAGDKVRINLYLRSDHREWADRNNKNLSAEVRDLLDQRIQERD